MPTFVIIPAFLAFGSKEKMSRTKLVSVRLSGGKYTRLAAAAETASTSPSTLLRDLTLASLGASVSTRSFEPAPATELLSRLTATEAEMLTSRARECDLLVAAYVRSVLRGSSRRSEAHAAVVALSRVGNNLNQLTRLAHSGTLVPRDLFLAIEALRTEVYRVREEILAAEERP